MPTKDKKIEQLTHINDTLPGFIDKQVILGKDFNTYLNP